MTIDIDEARIVVRKLLEANFTLAEVHEVTTTSKGVDEPAHKILKEMRSQIIKLRDEIPDAIIAIDNAIVKVTSSY